MKKGKKKEKTFFSLHLHRSSFVRKQLGSSINNAHCGCCRMIHWTHPAW